MNSTPAMPPRWGDQGNGSYVNPVLNADYSDPDIVRVDDDFYMIASEFHFMGMPVLHSRDLVNWTIIGRIYDRLTIDPAYDTCGRYGGGSWAPAIKYHNNRFWVYFCTPDEGLYMTSATNPAGPWAPLHEVKRVFHWEDPCPFWDDDGKAYLGHSLYGAGPIILHKMSPDGTQLLDDGVTVYNGPVAEGTKIYKRSGWYYLLIPEGGVATGWQTALRSRNIYGPYERRVVLWQGHTTVNGPHQGALVELDNGESWFMHFQDAGSIGRVCHLEPVRWVDDWPVMGVNPVDNGPGEPVKSFAAPRVRYKSSACTPATSDGFDSAALGLQWAWNHNPQDRRWSLSARPGWLRLQASHAPSFWQAPNTLTQKIMGRTGRAVCKLDIRGIVDGQEAGLCLMGGAPHWLYIFGEAGRRRVVVSNSGYQSSGPILNCDHVYLAVELDLDGLTLFSFSVDNTTFTPLGSSCALQSHSWKGSRLGLYSFNAQAEGGVADFDWFTYTHDGPNNPPLQER